MKNFTNYNYNVNEFAYKDEARIRGISLRGLIIILIIAAIAFFGIVEEMDIELDLFGEKYTIYEIEEMAEEALEDAEDIGYSSRNLKEAYIKRILEREGVEVDRYNITIDRYGNVNVEAK